jgi:hypothetical protein
MEYVRRRTDIPGPDVHSAILFLLGRHSCRPGCQFLKASYAHQTSDACRRFIRAGIECLRQKAGAGGGRAGQTGQRGAKPLASIRSWHIGAASCFGRHATGCSGGARGRCRPLQQGHDRRRRVRRHAPARPEQRPLCTGGHAEGARQALALLHAGAR